MRLVSFTTPDEPEPQAGVLIGEHTVPVAALLRWAREELGVRGPTALKERTHVPMRELFPPWDQAQRALAAAAGRVQRSRGLQDELGLPSSSVRLTAPVPEPVSVRDFYAFEDHVQRARSRRGEDVPEAWYDAPIFYFTNPASILGPEDEVHAPRECEQLDFELEVAWVIGHGGSDISPDSVEGHLLGLTIMNDWSARDIQAREMTVGLGPSKGKDFATSLGPELVTIDELTPHRRGDRFEMTMIARVNGREVSRGSLGDCHWTLAQMTAHASRDTRLRAGDVMATGTVGSGSILDLGTDEWLQPGDVVELEVEGLGVLRNTVAGKR